MKASEEFQVGKHSIGWLYDFDRLIEEEGDTFTASKALPPHTILPQDMTDAEIEKEITAGEYATLGDVLALLNYEDQKFKDGYANLFYFRGFVVRVRWGSAHREWYVGAWGRDDREWSVGGRVFSPATGTHSLNSGPSDTLTLPDELTINNIKYRRV